MALRAVKPMIRSLLLSYALSALLLALLAFALYSCGWKKASSIS